MGDAHARYMLFAIPIMYEFELFLPFWSLCMMSSDKSLFGKFVWEILTILFDILFVLLVPSQHFRKVHNSFCMRVLNCKELLVPFTLMPLTPKKA